MNNYNNMSNTLFYKLGEDIERIIFDMKFDLERVDRVNKHKETFEDCLTEIVGKRMRNHIELIMEDLNYTIGYDRIEVEYLRETDEDYIDYDLELNNMNNWTGFNVRDLTIDILIGFSRFENYDDMEDFIEECSCEYDEGDEDEDDLNIKYTMWYEDMEKKFLFITDILGDNGIMYSERNEFIEWIRNEL